MPPARKNNGMIWNPKVSHWVQGMVASSSGAVICPPGPGTKAVISQCPITTRTMAHARMKST